MSPLQLRITELWGQITAATHRFLELIGELDETEEWSCGGITSCAHWLNIYCGIGMVAAREKLRVARAIRGLPAINAAFREGRVSYSKVRAMTRVATPENEEVLLNIAVHGTASHVERTARYFRKVERIEEAIEAAAVHQDRYFDIRPDDCNHVILQGRVPIEVGAVIERAIDVMMELAELEPKLPWGAQGNSAESASAVELAVPEDRDSVGACRADALRVLAEQFLAHQEKLSGGGTDRYQIVVHINQQQLSGEDGDGRVRSEIEDGPSLAAETARRLGCDGALVGIVDDENGEPLNIGRKTRAIPAALRRALKARDGGCRFPGCSNTRFTEGHHIKHWANGGETKLENLVTLCHSHHHLLHEGGFEVERTDDGEFIFRAPEGDRLHHDLAVERRFRGIEVEAVNRNRDITIDPYTVVTRWQGEAMDYSMAIDALLAARTRTRARLRAERAAEASAA